MLPRRLVVIPALLAAALFAAAAASASPALSPETLQCDGTYNVGGNTHSPNPRIQVVVQDSIGIRISSQPMGAVSTTRELWNFNGVVTSSIVANPNGTAEYFYEYNDPNNSDTMIVGDCHYPTFTLGAVLSTTVNMLGATTCPATLPNPTGASTTYPSFFSAANFGTAAVFTGAAVQYASVTYNTTGLGDRPATYTLSAWIKSTGSSSQTIISEAEGGNGFWGFGLTNTNGLTIYDSRNTNSTIGNLTNVTMTTTTVLNNGTWHKVDVVRINGEYERLYLDGSVLGSVLASSTASFSNHSSSSTIFIGAYLAPGARIFTGQIDQLRVIDAALTDDDIRMEYLGSNLHLYAASPAASLSVVTSTSDFNPPISNGDTASAPFFPGEAITLASSANQRWIFEAQNTDSASTVLTTFTVTINISSPTAPQSLVGAPTSINSITWSWTAPSFFCPPPGSASVYYQLFDAVNGGAALNPPGQMTYTTTDQSITETVSGASPQNVLRSRSLSMTDTWGTGPLSASASAYTEAAVPTSLAEASVSTGGFVLSWSPNGNPLYTRYEVTYTMDPNFVVGVSTRVGLSGNYTAATIGFSGLSTGATYYVRVRAFNGQSSDSYGGVPTAPSSALIVVTDAGAPSLSGTPLGVSSITWNWTQVPGATGYTLFDAPTSATMFSGAALTFTSTTLSVNTLYTADIQGVLPGTTTALGQAFTYTLANPPAGPFGSTVNPSSVTFTWSANGNPSYTFYEVVVSTDPSFSLVVTTLSVSAPSATAVGLLPGVVYYSEVEAVNGIQVPTGFVAMPQVTTPGVSAITQSPSPNTPYVASTGLVGAWQFDEDTGTAAGDSSGNGNTGNFGCAVVSPALTCVSTPTWAGGPPGLGSAASFSGLLGGEVVTTAGVPFNFTDSLTVEAWVYPQTAAQQSGAGIVTRGASGAEDFALAVSGSRTLQFLSSNGVAATAAAALAPGQWTHVVGVYDSVANTATLYLNGLSAASASAPSLRTNHAGQPVAIGNWLNGALPFFGRIDSVRILHAAETAPQVLADYQGSFVSSVTAPAPNTGIVVGLPPNAFGAPAEIFITADPVNHPIRVAPAALAAGIASPPAGLTLVPNSLVEVVPVVGGVPFTTPLGSSATLTIPYNDPGGTGVIAGTNPPLAVSGLQLYTLNTAVNTWTLLPTYINKAGASVTGVTPHFSVFALFAPQTIGANLSAVRVYPVPWKPGSNGRFDAPGVTFADLPANGTISILTLSGLRVRDFAFSGVSAGTAVWDGTNDAGRRAASGVYFARITSSADNSTTIVKFAIER